MASEATPGEVHDFLLGEDGTRLFVRHRGEGLATHGTALFCDGILCDGFIWKYLWTELADLLPVSHWHYRGHGRSANPVDVDRVDIVAHATDLRSVRRHLGDPPCVLLGHSMGCQVAIEGYRVEPKNVKGLVLICGSFGKVTSTFKGGPVLDFLLPKLLDAVIKAPEVARAIWSRFPSEPALKLAMKLGEVDASRIRQEDLMPYLHHLSHVDFPMFLRMLQAAGDHSAGDMLSQIKVPTLIIAGERDSFTPPHLSEWMAETIPGAELLVVPGGTHVAPIEQPELIGQRIAKFLKERVLPTINHVE